MACTAPARLSGGASCPTNSRTVWDTLRRQKVKSDTGSPISRRIEFHWHQRGDGTRCHVSLVIAAGGQSPALHTRGLIVLDKAHVMCRPVEEPAPPKSAGLHIVRAVAPSKFSRANGCAYRLGSSHRRRFVTDANVCCADQYGSQGSRVWKLRYSLAVCTVRWTPLLKSDSCSHDTGIETPIPGRARAENAVAVVCALPLRR